jgi:hypothetical protein
MNDIGIGNTLNQIVWTSRAAMFDQSEFAQLTYGAFDQAAQRMNESGNEEFAVTFPAGYLADHTTIPFTRTYKKDQLLGRYQYLAFHQLSINLIFQLVTLVESMLSDILRHIVVRYPRKLGAKRQIQLQHLLESQTIEEVHLRATDALVNELSFKSPADFAITFEELTGVRLLECPAFHRYIEVKATRDVYIHNRGVANDTYVRKAGSHARPRAGSLVHVDIQYFLESYECCLQVVDWLELELHTRWHSSEYELRNQTAQLPLSKRSSE